jgi:serine/threonine protein kinase
MLHPRFINPSSDLLEVGLIKLLGSKGSPKDEKSRQTARFVNALDDFISEATNWLRLGQHKNVVEVYEVISAGVWPYLILEYVKGHSDYGSELLNWIHRGTLYIPLCVDIAIQVCEGMIFASERFREIGKSFIHRDLTPRNILIGEGKIPKITDLGLAKVGEFIEENFGGDATNQLGFSRRGDICGTPPYMSPEQCLGRKDIDIRSDIYSFGCVLYEMLTRRYVFNAKTPEEFINHHLHTSPSPPNIHQKLDNVVMRCIEKDRSKRFESFQDLREALLDLQNRPEQRAGLDRAVQGKNLQTGAVDLINRGFSLFAAANFSFAIDYNSQEHMDLLREITECFRQAKELEPMSAEAHYCLGRALYALAGHHPDQSTLDVIKNEYEEALRLAPYFCVALSALGEVYLKQGKPAEAISCFIKAEKYDRLAEIFEGMGLLKEALDSYSKLVTYGSSWYKAASRYPWYVFFSNQQLGVRAAVKKIEEIKRKIGGGTK